MPKPINNFQITGTLCKDPEIIIKEKAGKPLKLAKYTIAFDWWHGKRLPKPWYFDIVSFGYAADSVQKFLKKGKRILITEAYVEVRVYDGADGKKHKGWSIIAEDFVLLGYNDKTEGKDFDEVMQELVDDEEIPY